MLFAYRILERHIDTERLLTRSLVQVAALFRPELLIEIEAVAVVAAPQDQRQTLQ